jgi:lysophospholipase L1-like esterase
MAYVPVEFVDDNLPALNAENLNKMDDQIVNNDVRLTDLEPKVAANDAKETNVTTDLSTTATSTTRTVVSSDGTNAVLPVATASEAGVMSTADRIKLDGGSTAPAPLDDNIIHEIPTNTTVGWTGDTARLSTDGTSLTLTPGGVSTVVEQTIPFILSGDFVSFFTVTADSVVGSGVNWQLGGAGDGRLILSLGYNWETSAYEQNRVSVRGGITGGVAGPLIDYSVNEIEVAVQYDSRLQVSNLFIKESGAWVFYGGMSNTDPYRTLQRFYAGGTFNASGTIKDWFYARPNIAAIGDSICAGHNFYDPDPTFYAGDDNYLNTWMGHSQIYRNLRNTLIVNYGIGSQNSLEIQNRTADMMTKTSAKVVFIHASTNDYGAGFTDVQRSSYIQGAIDLVIAGGGEAILLNAVYPNSGSASYPANADFYRNWWNTFSGAITDAFLIDIMLDSNILDGNYMNTIYTETDGVHPNVSGYTLIGNLVEAEVNGPPSFLTDIMTTPGDILYRNASNVTARLPIGPVGSVLTSDGTNLAWV